MNLEKAKLTMIVRLLILKLSCVRYIIIEGDLIYVIDKFRPKEKDNSWLGAMVEATILRISIMHSHKDNFI